MIPHPPHRAAPLLALLLVTSGCASTWGGASADGAPNGPPAGDAPAARPATGATLDELEALYAERKAAELRDVSEADVAFMTGMISHHAQALVMSSHAPANGASSPVRTLAARIINAQKDEIRNMQRWLRDRGRPVPSVPGVDAGGAASDAAARAGPPRTDAPSPGEHTGHGGHAGPGKVMDHAGMPGMLTPAQLAELAGATGADFDRLFLTYMIQHHEGAVVMVRELFATDGAVRDDTIFKIASDIQVDQVTEIDRMQRMLDALPAGDGGSPFLQD